MSLDREQTDVEPTDVEPTDVERSDVEPSDVEPRDGAPRDVEPRDGAASDGAPGSGDPRSGDPGSGDPATEPIGSEPSDRAPASGDPETDDADADDEEGGRGPLRSRLAVGLVVLATGLPFAIALGVLRHPRWYPYGEMAQTELRVRDVFSPNPPMVGLSGRIGGVGASQGSHPGPLSFWSLAPFHRLFGDSAWSLHTAVACIQVIAMGFTLWLARRRGGIGAMLGMAIMLVVLAKAYGPYLLTEPWNPYMPVLWWVAFVVAVWSVVRGDLVALPVAVFAGSFCSQTHISYAVLVGTLGGTGALAALVWTWKRWGDAPARWAAVRWIAAGTVVGAIVWSPPVAEQIRATGQGNFSKLFEHFRHPSEEPMGVGPALDMLLRQLNPWRLVSELPFPEFVWVEGSIVPGAVTLALWAAAVVVAWRLRHHALLSLHLVLAVAMVFGLASISRIFGPPFYYLTLWGWGISALVALAIGWTLVLLADRLVPADARPRLAAAGAAIGVVALVVTTSQFAVDAAHVEVTEPQLSRSMDAIVPDTIAELDDRGRDGRYLITGNDPTYFAARTFALINELDRAGFDVRVSPAQQVTLTKHRTIEPGQATAEVHLAVGPDIDVWANEPGAEQIAFYDPADRDERAEFDRLQQEVIDELEESGQADRIPDFEANPDGLGLNKVFGGEIAEKVARMIEIGEPIAVFIGPER